MNKMISRGLIALALIASQTAMFAAPALAQDAQGVSIRQAASPSDCRSGEGIATRHGEFVGCARLSEPQRQRIRSREREALAAVSPDRQDWCEHVYVPATNDSDATVAIDRGLHEGVSSGVAVGQYRGVDNNTPLAVGLAVGVVGAFFGAYDQHRQRTNDMNRCELADQYYGRH